ncbi:MAG TPA: PKD domain-containing protein [Solirubrobacteraceae bacterium]|nr:PKD domain-containing protein [Solirubrobacteraceae bacterium]
MRALNAWRAKLRGATLGRRPRAGAPPARALALGALLAGALLGTALGWAATAAPALAAPAIGYAKTSDACPPPSPGEATCFAQVREPVPASAAGQPGVQRYTVGDGASKAGPAGGLTPAELASAYGYEASGGSGQTVAIVDAYDDPAIESDLAVFDAEYGLPACTKADGCLTKVSQTGSTSSLPEADKSGWSVEISLDVEVVHSVCPGCKILLVEANNAGFVNLATAVDEAASLGAGEISNSYGGPEERFTATRVESAYEHPGIVIAAATGDYGYDDWTYLNEGAQPPGVPNMPATLPAVVAVGGTTLELNAAGERASETVWNGNGPLNESTYAEGATGGGCSALFTAPPWQSHAPGFAASGCGSSRLAADVSAVADPNTGFDIFDSFNCGPECKRFKGGRNWITIGGTSLATPLISALYGLAGGSHGVGYPALTLYGHLAAGSDLYDVTTGGSGFCGGAPQALCGHPDELGALIEGEALDVDCEYTTACNATAGYDGPSGVGTPDGLGLFQPLAPTAALTAPETLEAGSPASFSAAASSDPYPGGSISSYAWSWGDGTSGEGVSPAHTYARAGEYTLTLTVTDSYGLRSDPITRAVKVEPRDEQEAEERKQAEEEEAAAKKAEEEVAAKKAEEEAAAERKAEEEAARAKAAEEVVLLEIVRQHEQEEAARKKAEEEAAAKLALVTGTPSSGVSAFQASPTPAAAPDVTLAGHPSRVSAGGRLTLRLRCPADESSCAGTLELRSASPVRAAGAHAKATILKLAAARFEIPGGAVRLFTVRLSPEARALLARARSLRVRLGLVAHDPQGRRHSSQTTLVLRAARGSRART